MAGFVWFPFFFLLLGLRLRERTNLTGGRTGRNMVFGVQEGEAFAHGCGYYQWGAEVGGVEWSGVEEERGWLLEI